MREQINYVKTTKEAYLSNFVDKRDGEKIYAKWKREEEIGIVVFEGIDDTPIGTIYLTDSFYFLYCLDGEISFYCKDKDNLINLEKGELIVVNPYCPLIFEPGNKYFIVALMKVTNKYFFKEYFSIINNNKRLFHFFLDSFNGMDNADYLYFKNLPEDLIDTTFIGINEEYNKEIIEKNMMMRALLQILLVHLSRSMVENTNDELEDKILQYIVYNPKTSLKDTAAHFQYHPNYISNCMKKKLGQTFKQILIQSRMDKATSYLKNSSYSIEEIAQMVGYADSITFYKAFKKYYGVTPKEVRRK
ncbi:MAG: helix-turn-helix transcriptional regulator [Acholeplasmatales bacterium]|nr:helix-turn-helix transcriptional regulator [Acholeplasmatales bacterium]